MDSMALALTALAACFGVVAFVAFQRLRFLVGACYALKNCVYDLDKRARELEQAARINAAQNVARIDESRDATLNS